MSVALSTGSINNAKLIFCRENDLPFE